MRNFDIAKYFQKQLLEAIDEDQPPEEQDQPPEQPAEPTPDQTQKAVKAISTPFDELKEQIIKAAQFKAAQNGGSFVILVEGSTRPYTISWQNNSVTFQKPNGQIIKLS